MPRKDIYKDAVPFKRQGDLPGDVPLAKTTFGVRLPADIDKAIRALPEPTAWARQVLIQAVKRELLGQAQGTGKENQEPSPPPGSPQVDVQELVQELSHILTMHGIPQKARQAIKELIGRLQSSQGRLPL